MGKKNLEVSVIICTYTMERLGDIQETVESVLTQTLQPCEVIIAVDNNEQLYQRLKTELSSKVKVVLNQDTQGLSETRNVGIRASAGNIIAFIDDFWFGPVRVGVKSTFCSHFSSRLIVMRSISVTVSPLMAICTL